MNLFKIEILKSNRGKFWVKSTYPIHNGKVTPEFNIYENYSNIHSLGYDGVDQLFKALEKWKKENPRPTKKYVNLYHQVRDCPRGEEVWCSLAYPTLNKAREGSSREGSSREGFLRTVEIEVPCG